MIVFVRTKENLDLIMACVSIISSEIFIFYITNIEQLLETTAVIARKYVEFLLQPGDIMQESVANSFHVLSGFHHYSLLLFVMSHNTRK